MKTLLVSASASEVRYVVRILQGTLRIGVLEKTLIMGLAHALLITQALRGEFDPTIPLTSDGGAEEGAERASEKIHVLKKEEGESSNKGKEKAKKKIFQNIKRKKDEQEEAKEEEEEEDEFERKPPSGTNREKEEEREEEEAERGASEDEEEEEEEEEEAEEMEEEEEGEEGKTNTRGTGRVGRFPSNDALKEAGEIVNRLFNEMPSYDVVIPILLHDSLQALRNRALLSPGTIIITIFVSTR